MSREFPREADGIVARILIASIGGAIITVSILLGMSEIAAKFRERDPTQYFRIVDFIPAPDGWRRPEFRDPTLPPERAQLPFDGEGAAVPVEVPEADIGTIDADVAPVVIDEDTVEQALSE